MSLPPGPGPEPIAASPALPLTRPPAFPALASGPEPAFVPPLELPALAVVPPLPAVDPLLKLLLLQPPSTSDAVDTARVHPSSIASRPLIPTDLIVSPP